MNLLDIASGEIKSNIIELVDSELYKGRLELCESYEELVEGLVEILSHESAVIVRLPISFGKDSTVCMAIVLEAYTRGIERGVVEPDRPLISNSVNTQAESLPMVMFSRYASKQLEAFAAKSRINLIFSTVSPNISDEYFVRFGNASKIIPSPTRSTDCTPILKIGPSEVFEKAIKKQLANTKYENSPILLVLGSRNSESSVRASRIKRFNLNVSFENLKEQLDAGSKSLQMAPIYEWDKDDVFEFLKLVGNDPVVQNPLNIPFFMDNAALLLEIYGNGSQDVCEISNGKTRNTSCGGKNARYGCFVCTQSKHDKSAEENIKLTRWSILGSESALRVHDWLFRIGHSEAARAYMPKTYDRVAFNRVFLQPNCLKARYLERMVWYASMLTQDSKIAAEQFNVHLKEGTLDQHPGYKEILEDVTLPPKAKSQFLKMYAQEAGTQLINVYSDAHAIVASLQWSMYGIASPIYRPLAIWDKVTKGERIPYPKTHSEYELSTGVKVEVNSSVPEVVTIATMNESISVESYLNEKVDITEIYPIPSHIINAAEYDLNPTIKSSISMTPLKVEYTYKIELKEDQSGQYSGYAHFEGQLSLISWDIELEITNLKVLNKCRSDLIESSNPSINRLIMDSLTAEMRTVLENNSYASLSQIQESINSNEVMKKTLYFPHIKVSKNKGIVRFESLSSAGRRKRFTQKVIKLFPCKEGDACLTKNNKPFNLKKGNQRVGHYPIQELPRLAENKLLETDKFEVDFETGIEISVEEPIKETSFSIKDPNFSIKLDQIDFELLKEFKSYALESHNHELDYKVYAAKKYGSKIRTGQGPIAAYEIVNNGLVRLSSTYIPKFQEICKRTYAFKEMGILDKANLTRQQLFETSRIHSVDNYRSLKAKVLLEIRSRLNLQRRNVVQLTESRAKANLHSAKIQLENYLSNQGEYVKASMDLNYIGRANCAFIDNPVSVMSRGRAYMTCAQLNSSDNLNTLLTNFIGLAQFKELKESDALIELHRILQKDSTGIKIKSTIDKYNSILIELKNLLVELERGEPLVDVKKQWAELMVNTHSQPKEMFVIAFQTKNTEPQKSFKRRLVRQVNGIIEDLGFAADILDRLEHLKQSSKKESVSNAPVSSVLSAFAFAS